MRLTDFGMKVDVLPVDKIDNMQTTLRDFGLKFILSPDQQTLDSFVTKEG